MDKPPKVRSEFIGPKKDVELTDYAWWSQEGDAVADSVQAVVNNIVKTQDYQRTLNLRYARLYGNLEVFGLGYGSYRRNTPQTVPDNAVTYNVVKSVIDTAAAKISQNRPRPLFLTSGGNYAQQERAKKLTKYVDGVFYDTHAYRKAQDAFIDAGVFGTGCLKVFIEEGRVRLERVTPTELVVDDADGRYGKPRQLHQVRLVGRQALLEMYPEHEVAIKSAHSALDDSDSNVADMVEVTESWYLGKRHAITIEGKTLFDEEYTKTYFPFVFFNWNKRLAGFFGQGLAENLVGIQIEINKILKTIQKAQAIASVPRVFLESSSKVSTAQLTNQIGSIVKYTGKAPTIHTAQALNPEVYNHLKWLIQSAYEIPGISQLSAQSKKPSGLDSGVALREYNDIESERFMLQGQRWEAFFLDLAKIIIDMSRDIYEHDKGLLVNVIGKDFIETIKWADVDLKDDQFIMKVYPTNLLPTTPAGKLQKLQELIQTGMISPEEGRELLDFPDLEAFATLASADKKLTDKIINTIVEDGQYNPPEPESNLEYATKKAQQAYLAGILNDLPEERLEMLLRYMDDAARLLKAQTPPPAPAPAPAAPMAAPEPLPQSDLLPQV